MCQSNYDWVGEVSKGKHRLLAEYEYLLNFSVVQLVHTSTVGAVRSIKALKVKINSLYTKCQSNYDWVGEVSKEKHRLLAEYEYLLNFSVVQLVHTSTVVQYDQ